MAVKELELVQLTLPLNLEETILHGILEVRQTPDRGRGVFALEAIGQGNLVVVGKPLRISPVRTDMSFQVAEDMHVDLDDPAERINHSCNPNLGLRSNEHGGYDFYARRAIMAGEELTWCYPTTEYESIAVRECMCGSANCQGQVTGWEALSDEMKKTFLYEGFVAPFILDKINQN